MPQPPSPPVSQTEIPIIREKAAQFEALFHASDDLVFLCDLTGRFLDGNPAILAATGFTSEELREFSLHDFVSGTELPAFHEALDRLLSGDAASTKLDVQWRRKSGEFLFLDLKAALVFLGEEPVKILGWARDITGEMVRRNEITDQSRHFQTLMENTKDWFWTLDADMQFTFCSPAIEKLLGFTAEELLGKPIWDIQSTISRRFSMALFREFFFSHEGPLEALGQQTKPMSFLHKNGKKVLTEVTVSPVFSEGRFAGLNGVARHIFGHEPENPNDKSSSK